MEARRKPSKPPGFRSRRCRRRTSHRQPCAGDQLQTMFTHWRGSPLPCARFPPPSMTLKTASMPRSPLSTARFRVSVVERLSMWKPSPFAHPGDVELQEAVALLSPDQEPVAAAVPHAVSADDVVGAADRRMPDPEADAGAASMSDHVVGDQVAVSLLDPDPFAASEDPVSGDHVAAAGTKRDPPAVTDEPIVSDPKALAPLQEEPFAVVARHDVAPDQGVGGTNGVDSETGVVPERAFQDPVVMRLEHEHPRQVNRASLRPVCSAVSHETPNAPKEEDAEKPVPRGRDARDAEVTGGAEVESICELAHRSMLHGDAVLTPSRPPRGRRARLKRNRRRACRRRRSCGRSGSG